MTEAITTETLIGDLVNKYPHLVDTLLSYGVHCVGCHVSPFEALGDGLASHGMPEEKITEALNKLNEVHNKHLETTKESQESTKNQSESKEEDNSSPTLTLTQKAADKIKELTKEHAKDALMIAVKPGGCSGYEYVLELISKDEKQDDQITISDKEVKIYIDNESLKIIAGSQVDYKNTLQDAGFKITNPNAKNTCGCGNSFS